MKQITGFSIALALVFITLLACQKDPVFTSNEKHLPLLPFVPYNYTSNAPTGLQGQDQTPSNNQITNHGATLGRVLFYDAALSINNTISCASCHKQALAFADGRKESVGFEGRVTKRNSPPVQNMRFSQFFFWDFSESVLENQVLAPIRNHIEMGMEDLDYLEEKLARIEYYPALFQKAFGSPAVNKDRIAKAMAQFIRSMTSFDSKFDHSRQNDFHDFNSLEKMGMEIFRTSSCNNCHQIFSNGSITATDDDPYNGTGSDLANIGLDEVSEDPGFRNGIFKVPSLRNIALTAPYMHDGRFATLREVIDHYDHGVVQNPALDFRLRDGATPGGEPIRMNLSEVEKVALEAFMHTLTDHDFIRDQRFSDPFNQ